MSLANESVILKTVDGLVGITAPKLAAWKIRMAESRSIHTIWVQAEIQFLQYRLEVVEQWPDSARKQATIAAILSQLRRHTSA